MITQLTGALVRGGLVAILVATPALLLPFSSTDTAQAVTLLALAAGILTFIEYYSAYPSLVEFRDAPPFNRIRFLALFATVFILAVIARGEVFGGTLPLFFKAIGALVGHAMDFPYSPVRLVILSLPENADPALLHSIRSAAGLSYLVALIALTVFYLVLKMNNWPSQNGAFNVWVNLPTFDPSAGDDVVNRLRRDARINLALGFLLPFLIPAVVKSASVLFGPLVLDAAQTRIWLVSAWAFLPLSLFMRGIAMGRVADMIADKRRRSTAHESESEFLAA